MKLLGLYEYSVLRAIQILEGQAYGAEIDRFLTGLRGTKRPATAQVYMCLIRLQEQGLVATHKTKSTPKRGGKGKIVYTVKPKGVTVIKGILTYLEKLHAGGNNGYSY